MHIRFTEAAAKDYAYWQKNDPKKCARIRTLCEDIVEHPFSGIGKPEPLKYDLQGCWSRRIDRTHRLVYAMKKEKMVIISCRYHY